MILHRSGGLPAGAHRMARPAVTGLPKRRVTAVLLLAAAVLDLTRAASPAPGTRPTAGALVNLWARLPVSLDMAGPLRAAW
jgi:hypothetical protein